MSHHVGPLNLQWREHRVSVGLQSLIFRGYLGESFVEMAQFIPKFIDDTIFCLSELDHLFIPLPVHIVDLYLQLFQFDCQYSYISRFQSDSLLQLILPLCFGELQFGLEDINLFVLFWEAIFFLVFLIHSPQQINFLLLIVENIFLLLQLR